MTDFDEFFRVHGKPQHGATANKSELKKYAKVPAALVEFWERFGFGTYADGLLTVANPKLLGNVLAEWGLKAAVPVVYTAFGDVIFWQKNKFSLLDVNHHKIFDAGTNAEVLFCFYLVDGESIKHILHEPLFRKTHKKLGLLGPDEIYGYKLPLAMGGDAGIGNMAKVKVREHLSILAQLNSSP